MNYIKDFTKAITMLSSANDVYSIFRDWLFVVSSSLIQANNCIANKFDEELEGKILATQKKYKEPKYFAEAYAILTLALQEQPRDFLGEWAGEAGQLYSRTGQFFTPYSLAQATARTTLIDMSSFKKPFSIGEPSCGSGAMVIATFEELKRQGFSENDFYFIAQDLDEKCYQMSFIQFSILGISAVLKLGNTLSSEILEEVKTLAYLLNYPISYNSKKTKPIKDEQLKFNL